MLSVDSREPIAIIGMGCRFPGAPSQQAYWRLLREGLDAVRQVPASRWAQGTLCDLDPAALSTMVSHRGGFIDKVYEFDWRAFRITPREAKYMDPQHRLLLEVAWEALEDAGLPFEQVAGSRAGVFIAAMWNDYLRMQSGVPSQLTGYSATGNAFAFAPGRISHTFDLRGPSVAIDSACAGSLASVHTACQSLWTDEVDLALAGGVNLMLSPDINIMLSRAGLLSSEGHCRPIDVRADGFVRGEGAGILVLRKRSQLAPSDRVYAFIRATAMNHNGRHGWMTATSPSAQEAVIRDVYRLAGIDPADIDYVELHGSGFSKGDAIEVKALGAVVGAQTGREQPCAIGSVKSNIGHLESAAGIASIVKVALSLHHREIPPTLHLQDVNPGIPLEALGLAPQKVCKPWPNKVGPLLAGVTAISMSGVNAHMVLEGPPRDAAHHPQTAQTGHALPHLLLLSARCPEALSSLAKSFGNFLTDEESTACFSLRDICYTASVRRSHHEHRLALVGQSRKMLVESIGAFLQGQLPTGAYSSEAMASEQDIRTDEAEAMSHCLLRRDQAGTVIPSLPGDNEARAVTLEALGTLYALGHTVDWCALYPEGGRCVQLPTYPWQRERLWLDWLGHQESLSRPPAETQVAVKPSVEPGEFVRRLKEAPQNKRRVLLLAHVRDQVARVLGLGPAHSLEVQQGLFDAGLDSLGVVELMTHLQASLGHPLPATLVFDYPTIKDLADYIAREVLSWDSLGASDTETQKNANVSDETTVAKLEQLSEEEAEALLLERLKAIKNE